MKSGTPKTYTLIPNTGQLNNLVRPLMNWYGVYAAILNFTPWNPQIETSLRKNGSATTGAYKTKHFV